MMQDFKDKKILLGVCGGIAAYKAAFLIRELTRLGAVVRVVMTDSAMQFITPLTLQAVSGHEVHTTLFDETAERGMGHIALARWPDFILIAPASANTIAKFAHGLADDLLSTIYLASTAPVIVCPGMNQHMWHHLATQENCVRLRARGALIIGPDEGSQACGDFGLGRLSDIETIIDALRLYDMTNLLAGRKVLITAGPTRESIDPVRFLSNHSSGKMGYALAKAALMAGAEVTLITGPSHLPVPCGAHTIPIESASEMYHAVMTHLQSNMIFIGCAAVADYSPLSFNSQKIKKDDSNAVLSLELKKNADILKAVSNSGKTSWIVGFAAETENLIKHAEKKLEIKQLDMIIANLVGGSTDTGFDSDYNQAIVITKFNQINLKKSNKVRMAGEIIAIIAANLQNSRILQEQ